MIPAGFNVKRGFISVYGGFKTFIGEKVKHLGVFVKHSGLIESHKKRFLFHRSRRFIFRCAEWMDGEASGGEVVCVDNTAELSNAVQSFLGEFGQVG